MVSAHSSSAEGWDANLRPVEPPKTLSSPKTAQLIDFKRKIHVS
jgi:hypothetical protein